MAADPVRTNLASRTINATGGQFAASIERWDAEIVAFDVVIDHPDLVPSRVRVPWPSTSSQARLELPALTLVKAAIVIGSVPRQGRSEPFTVTAFVRNAPLGRLDLVDQVATADDDTFRLRIEPDKETLVVVLAPELPPSCRWMRGRVGIDESTGVLALGTGVVAQGCVTAAPGIALDRAIIQFSARTSGPSIVFPGENLALEGDTVVRRHTKGQIGSSGEFRLEGLAPGSYRVIVAMPGLTGDLQEALSQEIVLPHVPLTFRVAGAVAELEVLGPRGELVQARVRIRSAEPTSGSPGTASNGPTISLRTDAHGRARLIGLPGHSYDLTVESAGYEKSKVTLTLDEEAGAGQDDAVSTNVGTAQSRVVRVELSAASKNATWEMVLAASSPAPDCASVGFCAPGSAEAAEPLFVRNATRTASGLRVSDVPAGRYRVVVRAGTTWEASRGFYVDAELDVEFAPGAAVSSSVELVRGGRLRLAAKADDGTGLPARVILRNAEGIIIPIWLTHRSVGQRFDSSDQLDEAGPSEVSAALPPGLYTVEFALPDHVPVRRTVRIEAGEVADVGATLVRG